jgi:hypothetical protein
VPLWDDLRESLSMPGNRLVLTSHSRIRERAWPCLAAAFSLGVASAALDASTFEGCGTAAPEGLRCASNAVETLVLHVPDGEARGVSRNAWLVDREAHVWRLDAVAPDTLTLASPLNAAAVTQVRAQLGAGITLPVRRMARGSAQEPLLGSR